MVNKVNASIVEGIGRVYHNDSFRYPSVTTVLQVIGNKDYLEDWREKVGAEFADAYTKEACDIGTAMHDDYEQHLSGNELKETISKEEKTARRMFKSSLKKFDSLFSETIAQEVLVISHAYKIAGRFDLLAKGHDGKTYLVDFKNTKRDKKREEIETYKFQLAFYHRMLGETFPEYKIDGHVVFMVNRDGFTKVFRFATDEVQDVELQRIRGKFFREFKM